jgi:hypothetical protein
VAMKSPAWRKCELQIGDYTEGWMDAGFDRR